MPLPLCADCPGKASRRQSDLRDRRRDLHRGDAGGLRRPSRRATRLDPLVVLKAEQQTSTIAGFTPARSPLQWSAPADRRHNGLEQSPSSCVPLVAAYLWPSSRGKVLYCDFENGTGEFNRMCRAIRACVFPQRLSFHEVTRIGQRGIHRRRSWRTREVGCACRDSPQILRRLDGLHPYPHA